MIIVSNLRENDIRRIRERNASEVFYQEANDNAVLRRLTEECERYDLKAHSGKRFECYLVVAEPDTLWLLQTVGLPEAVSEKADVLVTTIEDLVAKAVLVKLPNTPLPYPPLDRQPISADSDVTVHLVLFGCSAQMEALALNAALVAHYPNYCRDTRLRTRITLIDENVLEEKTALEMRYPHLLDNSYYRVLDLSVPHPVCRVHRPLNEGRRKDFVDVEWEFVVGDSRGAAVRQKLVEWSKSASQQLTLAFCYEDEGRNVSEALCLPEAVYENDISVLCHAENAEKLRYAKVDNRYRNVLTFGNSLFNLDILRVLKKLAKRVNYLYSHCFALTGDDVLSAPSTIDEAKMEEQWRAVKILPKVCSNVFNAMTLGTKMHSMGHSSTDWEAYYALTKAEIDILSEVEHNRWSVEELLLGYRPVTDEEQLLVEQDMAKPKGEREDLKRRLRSRKIHYDLRAYDDLRKDTTGKNVNVYDWVLTQGIPLIIKSCIVN